MDRFDPLSQAAVLVFETLKFHIKALFGFGIQSATSAFLVITMWRLTKVRVQVLFRDRLATNIAQFLATTTSHLVASIGLDEGCFALWARPNLGETNCLFYLEPSFILSF